MVDTELALRDYGESFEEACPPVTPAELGQRVAPAYRPPVPSRPRRPRWPHLVLAVAATAAFVVVMGALIGSRDRGERLMGDDEAPNGVELPAPGAHPNGVRPTDSEAELTPGAASATGATRLAGIDNAVPGDVGNEPLPLGTVSTLPTDARLDFLFEFCVPGSSGEDGADTDQLECWRDAHFMNPDDPALGSGVWVAGEPFHVRHGFVNDEPEPLGSGFDVVLYAYPMDGPAEFGGEETAETLRFTSDYVFRSEEERCGPGYREQSGPVTCELFVHHFPDGLAEGRWAIWVVWEAPCSAWADLGLVDNCTDGDAIESHFSSGFDAPFDLPGGFAPSYGEQDVGAMTQDELDEFLGTWWSGAEGETWTLPTLETDPSGAAATGAVPVPDFEGAIAGDDGAARLALGAVDALTYSDRLDFFSEGCYGADLCYRDASFVNPEDPLLRTSAWQSGRPFVVRHGFVNEGTEPLSDAYDLVVYVTPLDHPGESGGAPTGDTLRFSSDYVLRGEADQCGPTYRSQTGAVTCEWFVHEFDEGLPAGRHALWAFWEAPCEAWVELGFVDTCADPDQVMALFASGVDSPWETSEVSWEARPQSFRPAP